MEKEYANKPRADRLLPADWLLVGLKVL